MPENYRGVQLLTEDPGTQTHWDGRRVFNVQERPQVGGASIAGPGPRFSSMPLPPEPDAKSARAAQPPVGQRKPPRPKPTEKELMEMADKAIENIRKQQQGQLARGPAVNADGTGYAQGLPMPAHAPRRPVQAPKEEAPVMRSRAAAEGTAANVVAKRGMGGSKSETVPTSQAMFSPNLDKNVRAEVVQDHPSAMMNQWVDNKVMPNIDTFMELLRRSPTAGKQVPLNLGMHGARWAAQTGTNKLNKAQEHYMTHPEDIPLSRYNEPFRQKVLAPIERVESKLDDYASNNLTFYQNHKRDILDKRIEEYQRKLDEAKKKAPVDGGEIE